MEVTNKESIVMHGKRNWTRKFAGPILASALAFLAAGRAQAGLFTYTAGDLTGVFEANGTDFVYDFGQLGSLTNGKVFNIPTSSVLPATGGIGGIFTAFSTKGPFTGTSGRDVTYTTDPSINPHLTYDNPPNGTLHLSDYILKIGPAQVSLDDGSGGGWLPNLNAAPPTGTGGILLNTANSLALPTSSSSSYNFVIGLGTNRINNKLPFSTAVTLAGASQVLDLWTAVQTATTTSSTTLVGTLNVEGNPNSDGSLLRVTFNAVPEPGTLLLLSLGLSGIAWAGSRKGRTPL